MRRYETKPFLRYFAAVFHAYLPPFLSYTAPIPTAEHTNQTKNFATALAITTHIFTLKVTKRIMNYEYKSHPESSSFSEDKSEKVSKTHIIHLKTFKSISSPLYSNNLSITPLIIPFCSLCTVDFSSNCCLL